jgi:hypothetical protein
MDKYIKQLDGTLNNTLNNFVMKPTLVRGVIHLLLILYAARIAPSLPKPVFQLFENAYFKLFVFSLILWTAQFSPSTSILISLAFMVTTNYANQRPLWEFLENVDPTQAPVSPSKEIAVNAVVTAVEEQNKQIPVVTNIAQKEETLVIQPTIVDTPQGPTVVNPTIVVAPAIVTSPSGEKVLINPDVTMIEPPASAPATSTSEPAPAPADHKMQESTPETQAGCYPIRRYNMSKISAYEGTDSYGTV